MKLCFIFHYYYIIIIMLCSFQIYPQYIFLFYLLFSNFHILLCTSITILIILLISYFYRMSALLIYNFLSSYYQLCGRFGVFHFTLSEATVIHSQFIVTVSSCAHLSSDILFVEFFNGLCLISCYTHPSSYGAFFLSAVLRRLNLSSFLLSTMRDIKPFNRRIHFMQNFNK